MLKTYDSGDSGGLFKGNLVASLRIKPVSIKVVERKRHNPDDNFGISQTF